jgi:MFS transporter, ACS family, hexuronate transporter
MASRVQRADGDNSGVQPASSSPETPVTSAAIRGVGSRLRTIRHLRWWIGALLFFSTVINYLDRQTLSVLAPYLKEDYKWSNADYAIIIISFRIAYTIGQITLGRLIDRIGTRAGLSMTVLWYSVVAMLTAVLSFVTSPVAALAGFVVFRFLLGLGESPDWPAILYPLSDQLSNDLTL